MIGGTGRIVIQGTLGDAASWGNSPAAVDCSVKRRNLLRRPHRLLDP